MHDEFAILAMSSFPKPDNTPAWEQRAQMEKTEDLWQGFLSSMSARAVLAQHRMNSVRSCLESAVLNGMSEHAIQEVQTHVTYIVDELRREFHVYNWLRSQKYTELSFEGVVARLQRDRVSLRNLKERREASRKADLSIAQGALNLLTTGSSRLSCAVEPVELLISELNKPEQIRPPAEETALLLLEMTVLRIIAQVKGHDSIFMS